MSSCSHSSGCWRKRCHGLAERRSAGELGHSSTLGMRSRGRRGRNSHSATMTGSAASSQKPAGLSKLSDTGSPSREAPLSEPCGSSLEDPRARQRFEECVLQGCGGIDRDVPQTEPSARLVNRVDERAQPRLIVANLARAKACLAQLARLAVLKLDFVPERRVPLVGRQNLQHDIQLLAAAEEL